MGAIPVHHTDTEDKSWDGPAMKKRLPNDEKTLRSAYAWVDPAGDLSTKAAYKFIHHHVTAAGDVGAANVKACLSGIGILNGGFGGTKIPASDRQGVWKHLAAHLEDADIKEADVPDLKSARSARATMNGGRQERAVDLRLVQVREAADKPGMLEFSGYASTTEDPYEMYDCFGPYTEVIRAGAFTKTITEKKDIYLLGFHDSSIPVAGYVNQTLLLEEDDTGLKVTAYLDASDPDVQRLAAKLRSGLLTKMSFGFYVIRQQWSPDWMQRDILEVELIEVSIVTWPANDSTAAQLLAAQHRAALTHRNGEGAEQSRIRAIQAELRITNPVSGPTTAVLVPLLDDFARWSPDGASQRRVGEIQEELRGGKALSAATQEILQTILDHIAAIDVMVDGDQPVLAGLLGVENPDDDADSVACPECAAMNDSDAKHCDQCGAAISDVSDDDGAKENSAALSPEVAQARATALRLRRPAPVS